MFFLIKKILKKAYFKIIFSLSANHTWVYRAYVKSLKFEHQRGTFESILDALSKQRDSIFVVQVGANDGLTHDPIHKFIRRDNWSGLLIEPQPYVYDKFLFPLHRKTPAIKTVNAAIGEFDTSADIYMIGFSNDRWATGLARFDRSALFELISSGGLDRRLRKEGLKKPQNQERWIKSQRIKVSSFDTLFDQFEINEADLLMIDTEGFDFEILKLFPWHRFKPTLIAYECFHLSPNELERSVSLLSHQGYQSHRDGPNMVAWLPQINNLITYET